MNKQGTIVRNKARLVAIKGYNQEERIDYNETCAHVARIEVVDYCLHMSIYVV